jgi:hypothetical protein
LQTQTKKSSQEKGDAVKAKGKKKKAVVKAVKKKATAKKATGRAKKENRPRNIEPHRSHPEVESLPYKWQPGTKDKPGSRGRPPTGWKKDKAGDYISPKGWLKIVGKWHKPMEKSKAKKGGKKRK